MKLVIGLIGLTLVGCGNNFFGKKSETSSNETTETTSTSAAKSLALDSKDDLPDCSDSNDKQLAYVIDEEQFYTCEDGDWAAIDVKGSLEENEWRDPVTGYVWLIGGVKTQFQLEAACDGDYAVASDTEIKEAAYHGLAPDDGVWLNQEDKYMDGGNITTESGNAKHHPVCVKK